MTRKVKPQRLLSTDSDSDFEEQSDADVDDLNLRKSDEEPFLKPENILYDKYNLAYIVIYLLGINTMIPWSFFITADAYWMYKFRDISPNETHSNFCRLENNYGMSGNRSELQASFISYVNMASAIPNTLFLIINTFLSRTISLSARMILSQCLILLVFVVTTTFVKVNTDTWQPTFLMVTLVSVVIVNAASAIFGGSLLGIVGRFPAKYVSAMSAGQPLGAIFASVAAIFSIWLGASPVLSGLLYFIIGDVVIFLALVAYIILERQIYFKHHIEVIKTRDQVEEPVSINPEITFSLDTVSYWQITKKISTYGFSIFFVFFATVLVYPSVTVLIESQTRGRPWNDKYFEPTITFLLYNCGDFAGRTLGGLIKRPRKKPWLVMILCIMRLAFIPLFMVCNAQPRHHLPVYIHQDIYYVILIILFALSNGYLTSLCFILAPTVVESHEKEIASSMMGAFLGCGFTVGSFISLLMVKFL